MRWSEPLTVAMISSKHAYEVRPRKDKRGVDLISDALPFGRLWCDGPGCCRQCTNTDKSYAESHLRCAIAGAVKAAAPDDVMNYAWRFGYLGRRYRNRKTVHIGVKRAARAISWF